MKHEHTLRLLGAGDTVSDITVGELVDPQSILETYRQRLRVYGRRGYLRADAFPEKQDKDDYDESGSCTYVAALNGDSRMLGSIRLIQAEKLPIQRFFTFETPSCMTGDYRRHGELSRFVIERKHPDDDHVPRNILLLFMVKVLLEIAHERQLICTYAYLKESLLKKMSLLRLPVGIIPEYTCVYPKDGPMAGYFYSDEPVVPAYFDVEAVRTYINDTLHDPKMFEFDDARRVYTLRHSIYNSFLKTLGII